MKEKLITLIQDSVGGCARHWAELIAERLIANGATLNKWIPVEESLPDPKEYDWVLVNVQANEDGSYYVPRTAEYRRGEWWEYGTDWKLSDMHLTVTHWMPLPDNPRRYKYGS